MSREEQIIEKASKDSEIFYRLNDNYGDCYRGGFIDGAKWSDEHPKSEIVNKQEFIEKACEWLFNNKNNYIIDIEGETLINDQIITDLRKAMEE